jgi:phosphatidylglycerol:prolipoprotein diacylglycerol transferase
VENYVGFPGLGLEFNISRTAFSLFGIDIYWYALIIATGIVLAYFYCNMEGKKQGLNTDIFSDILIVGLPSAIFGARLYYVIFNWSNYSGNILSVFNLRQGGIAIYGAVIGCVIAVYFYLKHKKQNVLKLFDICVIGLLIGQAMGRWGNFINIEAYGYETTSFLRMAIYEGGKLIYVHPTFLYESLWNLAGAILLAVIIRKKKFDGQIFLLYIIWYGFGRFFIEGLRTDSLMFFNLRVSQIVALVSVITAGVIYILKWRKNNG